MIFDDLFRSTERSLAFSSRNPFQDVVRGILGPSFGMTDAFRSHALVRGQADLVRQMTGALGLGHVDLLRQMGRPLGAFGPDSLGQVAMFRELASPAGVLGLTEVGRGVSDLLRFGRVGDQMMRMVNRLGSFPSFSELSVLSQFSLAAVTAGVAGSASAKSAVVHLAEGTIDDTPLGQILAKVEDPSSLFDDSFGDLFRGSLWDALPEPVRLQLKNLALWSFLLSLVTFFYGRCGAAGQAAVAAEQTALLEQQTVLLGRIFDEMEAVGDEETALRPEVRAIRRLCPVYAARSGRSPVQTALERGDLVVVLELRRKWIRLAFADLVTGQPQVGWARKKCTRPRRRRRR